MLFLKIKNNDLVFCGNKNNCDFNLLIYEWQLENTDKERIRLSKIIGSKSVHSFLFCLL